MSLKTLKDLKEKNDFRGLPQDNPIIDIGEYVEIDDLKAEAIREIDIFGDDLENRNMLPNKLCFDNKEAYNSVITYIKWKNNLTEEELKKQEEK